MIYGGSLFEDNDTLLLTETKIDLQRVVDEFQ